MREKYVNKNNNNNLKKHIDSVFSPLGFGLACRWCPHQIVASL